jgi:hypothetical protein
LRENSNSIEWFIPKILVLHWALLVFSLSFLVKIYVETFFQFICSFQPGRPAIPDDFQFPLSFPFLCAVPISSNLTPDSVFLTQRNSGQRLGQVIYSHIFLCAIPLMTSRYSNTIKSRSCRTLFVRWRDFQKLTSRIEYCANISTFLRQYRDLGEWSNERI